MVFLPFGQLVQSLARYEGTFFCSGNIDESDDLTIWTMKNDGMSLEKVTTELGDFKKGGIQDLQVFPLSFLVQY